MFKNVYSLQVGFVRNEGYQGNICITISANYKKFKQISSLKFSNLVVEAESNTE